MSGAVLWLFSLARDKVKLTIKVGFIYPCVVIDPANLGATVMVALALCLVMLASESVHIDINSLSLTRPGARGQGSRSDPLMHSAVSSIYRALPWIAFTISQSTTLPAWHPRNQYNNIIGYIRLLTRDPTISSKFPYRNTVERKLESAAWSSKAGILHLQIFVRPLTLPSVSIQKHAWCCTVLVYCWSYWHEIAGNSPKS